MHRRSDGESGLRTLRPVIAYIAPFAFPDGGAGARRVLGNAQSLVAAGYDVLVISAQVDGAGEGPRQLEPGIWIASTGERHSEHMPRALKRARYALMGSQTRKLIERAEASPAAVILYSGYTPYLLHLIGLCRHVGMPLIFDAVEWYSAKNRFRFLISPYLWNIEIAMRVLVPRLAGVIAISSYLANYYHTKGLAVVQVPPTLDVHSLSPRLQPDGAGPLRLAYCGSASNDLLGIVLAALTKIDPHGEFFRLEIAGPSVDEVVALARVASQNDLPDSVQAHGRTTHAEALQITRAADFSIFLRNINRVSTAGFPTKFAESFAVGTPVITNITSDLGAVLSDGLNGLVCPEPTVEALLPVLQRARFLRGSPLAAMRGSARAAAEAHFDNRRYSGDLRQFLVSCGVPAPQDVNERIVCA